MHWGGETHDLCVSDTVDGHLGRSEEDHFQLSHNQGTHFGSPGVKNFGLQKAVFVIFS